MSRALVDASAMVDLLVGTDQGARVDSALRAHRVDELITVAHFDAEVFSALARLHRAAVLSADDVADLLRRLGRSRVVRLPISAELLASAWRLRENVAARDALYVVAALSSRLPLLTTDERLVRAVDGLDVAVLTS